MTGLGDPGPQVLGVEGATHDYSGVVVLHGVTLTLRTGEIHALLGANGSGKSTLIKVMTGVVRPSTGRLHRDGADLVLTSPQHAQRAGIAVVHQNYNLFPAMTVEQNLLAGALDVPRRWSGVDHRAWRRRVTGVLQTLQVEFDPRDRVGDLGPAERKFVEIARAMLSEPRFLILDEPTAALEPDVAERVLTLMRHLAARGVGLLFVSHRLDEVAAVADRLSVLRDGRLVARRTVAEVDTGEMARLVVGADVPASAEPAPGVATVSPTGRAPAVRLALRDVQVVPGRRHFDLDLAEGEILAVTGLAGSGASTLVAMVGGDVPLSGTASGPAGIRVRLRSARDAAAAGIGFVPEDRTARGLVMESSCADNISLASLDRARRGPRVDRRRIGARAEEYRVRLDIRSPGIDHPVSALSGGNQQKVLLAKWLAAGVRTLVVQEPTQGVDIGGRGQIHDLLRRFCAAGGSVLVFSTDVDEVLALADRIAVLRHGELTRVADAADADQAALTEWTTRDPAPASATAGPDRQEQP